MERKLPEGWKRMNLIDALQTLESGARPKGGLKEVEDGVPSIGGEHLDKNGYIILNKMGFVPKEFYNNLRRGRIQKGDVLVVKDGATTGKVALVRKDFPYPEASVNEHVFICRPNIDRLLPEYLFYNLFSFNGQSQIRKSFHGSAQGGITTEFADSYKIAVPSLETQRRIVAILDKAEETRRLRAQADELAGRLIQSVFLEMFGDPVRNPKGWKNQNLKEISNKFSDGPFGSNLKTEHYTDSGIRVIRLQNIGVSRFIDDDRAYISEEHFSNLQKHSCSPGDILIGTMGDPNLRACILPKSVPLAINKADCVRLRPDKDLVLPEYVCHILNLPSILTAASNLVHGETRGRISSSQLADLSIPIPPLMLQERFSRRAAIAERILSNQKQNQIEITKLFESLLQKAFTGELVA